MLSNTIFFAIGNLGSKLIIFFLVPFYTFYLSPQELGAGDLFISIGMVLIPILTLSISDAVLRFQLEEDDISYSKALSSGILVVAFQGMLLTLGIFILSIFSFNLYIYIYTSIFVFSSSLFLVFQQYLKAVNQNKLYATLSIVHAVLICAFMITSLKFLGMGLNGFLISQALPPLFLALFLVIKLKNKIYLHIDFLYVKKMLEYSLPLMPNSIFWWIMQLSNRLLITFYLGIFSTGIFTVASKLPSLINIFTSIFIQAWQISAVELKQQKNKYYGTVFDLLFSSLLLIISILFLITDPLVDVLFSDEYQMAKKYIKPLYLSSFFSALAAFIATNYLVDMNTKMIFKSTLFGGIVNLIFSALTIPFLGLSGASISMLLSFTVTFFIRYMHSGFNKLVSNKILKIASIIPLFIIIVMESFFKINLQEIESILISLTLGLSGFEIFLLISKIRRFKNESSNGWS